MAPGHQPGGGLGVPGELGADEAVALAAEATALGIDGLEILRTDDPTELLVYQAVVVKAREARDLMDRALAARIIETLGQALK